MPIKYIELLWSNVTEFKMSISVFLEEITFTLY
jgi:hypothetical protein